MRLCTCGHRDARHDQLIGGCLACSCGVFDDFRSSIKEEIAALPPKWSAPLSMPPPDISLEEERPPALIFGTPEHADYMAEALALAEVDVAVLDGPALIEALSPLTDLDVLERFEAWRCAVCGSRSWKQIRCEVLPRCRSRWLEPVTVEIRRREVD